jgi:hypothetical protein
MAATQTTVIRRAKLVLVNSSEYDRWERSELPKLLDKYKGFNFVRMIDKSNDRNYVWYKTR